MTVIWCINKFQYLDFIIKDYEYNFRLTPKRYLILGLGLEPRSGSSGFILWIYLKIKRTKNSIISNRFLQKFLHYSHQQRQNRN